MLYYFYSGFLFGLYCLLLEIFKVERKLTLLMPALISMAFFVGLREFHIGTDTLSYIEIYSYMPSIDEYLTNFQTGYHGNRMEWGFFILLSILKGLSFPPNLMLIAISLGSLVTLAIAYRRICPNYYLGVFIFTVSILFLTLQYNILRQGLATSFVILAFSNLIEKKKGYYLFFSLIAVSFHVIALVSFLIYPLKSFKWQRNYFILIVLAFIGFGLVDVLATLVFQLRNVNIAFWRVFLYLQNSSDQLSIFSWMLISTIVLILLCVFFVRDIRAKFPYIDIIITYTVIGMLCMLLTRELSMLSLRIGYMFFAVEPILVMALLTLIKNEIPKFIAIFVFATLILSKNIFITAQFLSPYSY